MIVELPSDAPRLSLRWVSDGGPRDVVGHLLAANDEWFVILPEDGPTLWVPRSEVEAVRRVPERPVLPVSRPEDIERALEQAQPATRRARLGGWRLRDHSVLAIGDPGLPLADALDAVSVWGWRPADVRTLKGATSDTLGMLGHQLARTILVLTADLPTTVLPGAVPLTRGWAVEVDADDQKAIDAAVAAGFVERHRAVTLIRS